MVVVFLLRHGATGLQVWICRRRALEDKGWLQAAVLVADVVLTLLLLLVYLA